MSQINGLSSSLLAEDGQASWDCQVGIAKGCVTVQRTVYERFRENQGITIKTSIPVVVFRK